MSASVVGIRKNNKQTFTVLFPTEGFVMVVEACYYEMQDSGCYAFYDVPQSEVTMSRYKKNPVTPIMTTASNAGIVVFAGELPEIRKVSVCKAKKIQEQKIVTRRVQTPARQDKRGT